jgi:pimeloyl-ACP methyl ester carboxylesterase
MVNGCTRSWVGLLAALVLAWAGAGCKSMTPGQLDAVRRNSDKSYAGNVYLLRGFIGIWSYGVDHLGQKINDSGVRAHVYQEDQWRPLADKIIAEYKGKADAEPLVIVGHSYGADDALLLARKLGEHGIPVDLVVTLDPVTPPKAPASVKQVYNIYQPSLLDKLPFFRGVALEPESPEARNLVNVNIRAERRDLLKDDTDHFNIEKNEKIHAEVVKKIKEFCPPRQEWVARHGTALIGAAPDGRSVPGGGVTGGNPGRVNVESRRPALQNETSQFP